MNPSGKVLNKILEIDMDTSREVQLMITQIGQSPRRSAGRQPNSGFDHDDNIEIIAVALGAMIRTAEARGVHKVGQAMKRVMQILQEMYVNSELAGEMIEVDIEGNEIPGLPDRLL